MKTLPLLLCLFLVPPLSAQEEVPAAARPFLRHKLDIQVREIPVPDETDPRKIGLKLDVKVLNQEHVVRYSGLTLHVLVSGNYGGPKEDLARAKERMVLNHREPFDLDAGKTHLYTSPVLESGRDNPSHPHYGVFYEGYVVVVLDARGNVVAKSSNYKPLGERYKEIATVPAGEDFAHYVLISK